MRDGDLLRLGVTLGNDGDQCEGINWFEREKLLGCAREIDGSRPINWIARVPARHAKKNEGVSCPRFTFVKMF